MKLTVIEKTNGSISEYVYQVLRQNIISLNLEPGASISENEIASTLEVSRTPVREAFIKLAGEGLLEVYPQKGTVVSLVYLDRVEEAWFLRLNMEIATIKLACKNFPDNYLFDLQSNLNSQQFCVREKNYSKLFALDGEMHKTIFRGCKKERIWELIHLLNFDADRIRFFRLASDYDWEEVLFQHKKIVEAIVEKDSVKGQKYIVEQLEHIIIDQENFKLKYPTYFK